MVTSGQGWVAAVCRLRRPAANGEGHNHAAIHPRFRDLLCVYARPNLLRRTKRTVVLPATGLRADVAEDGCTRQLVGLSSASPQISKVGVSFLRAPVGPSPLAQEWRVVWVATLSHWDRPTVLGSDYSRRPRHRAFCLYLGTLDEGEWCRRPRGVRIDSSWANLSASGAMRLRGNHGRS